MIVFIVGIFLLTLLNRYAQLSIIWVGNCALGLLLFNTLIVANGTNCGSFAIANATSLLHGIEPETVTFNEYETREHLINCIEGKKLFPFPAANSIAERGCTSEIFSYELQCAICRLPNYADEKSNQIQSSS